MSVGPSRLQRLRRELHGIPEVGLHLPATQAVIRRELAALGIEDVHLGQDLSSVAAVIRGARPGPTVLLRADMDGLPVREGTGLEFASVNGAMHACGHDLHMAGALGAAEFLVAARDQLAGTVVIAFQPGEEGHGGGRIMVEEGVLELTGELPVASYAIHVWPGVEAGVFQTRSGPVMAGLNDLRVRVTGVGGHASSPHRLRDSVPVISEIVLALQTFISRRVDVHDPIVLSVTQLSAESAALNVVPESSRLGASVRTLSERSVAIIAEEVPRLVAGIAEAHGCVADVTFEEVYPVTMNSGAHVEHAVRVLRRDYGDDAVELLERPLMASEDFAFFLNQAPGTFLLLGARPREIAAEEAEGPHSPRVRFDDAVLDRYARAFAALAREALTVF